MDHDPELVEQAARAVHDTYGQGDRDRSERIARAVLDKVAPALMAQGARQVAEAVLDAAPRVNSELRYNGVPAPGISLYVEGFKDAHDAALGAVAHIEGGS